MGRPVARVRPDTALGWSLDGGDAGTAAPLLDPRNRARLRPLLHGPVSYRLRTELAGEVWHWSAHGRWSDPARGEGYWTGDATREDTSPASFGYRLPRRGNSRDEANDDGYSRLDDGDPATFWKSSPYLARPYIAERPERPEWIKVEFGRAEAIDGLRIAWRDPFARHLRVQFWQGPEDASGRWVTFPHGDVRVARSGVLDLQLADAPVSTAFVRLLMEDPSGTAPSGAADPRDSRGFAVAELQLGRWTGRELVDAVSHAADGRRQTRMVVSSTDPWHRAADRDPRIEQPSPLRLLHLGLLTPGAVMLPVGVLYDTPEDALAEVAYFTRFGLAPREVELGEEPEGQRTDPEVFARLYAVLAGRLHAQRPDLRLVTPSLINVLADTWLDDDPDESWTRRMLRALGPEGAPAPQGFTLEHYPDDDLCGDTALRLQRQPKVMAHLFDRLRDDGLPAATPIALTEIGQSAYSGLADVTLASSVFAATALAEFVSRGGAAAYVYSLTPGEPAAGTQACAGKGDMMAYEADAAGRARWEMPSLQAFRMVSRLWLQEGVAPTELFALPAQASDAPLAYAAHRPDGRWAVLLANPAGQPRSVRLRFEGGGPGAGGETRMWRYGPEEYRWSAAAGRPLGDRPPRRARGPRWGQTIVLPAYALAVVRDR